MAKRKWYQKSTYLLIALALALASGVLIVPETAASPGEDTFYSKDSDGYLLEVARVSEGYLDAQQDPSGSVFSDHVDLSVGQEYDSDFYWVFRGALFFDTRSLPDDACITSATLSLYGELDLSFTDFLITVVDGSVLDEPLVGADYGDLRNQTVSGGSLNTAYGGFSSGVYNDISLNGMGMGWISKTGTTKLGLRSSRDIAVIAPSGDEFVLVYTSEKGEGYQPKLVVNYTTPPVAAFKATPTSGCAPLTVKFTDKSTGSPTSWSWTFGDAGTSTDQNPSHNYTSLGTYSVTLTVGSDCGSNSTTKSNFITASEAPPPAPPAVGGEAHPVSRLAILAPWIALAAAVVVGAGVFVLRRRRA